MGDDSKANVTQSWSNSLIRTLSDLVRPMTEDEFFGRFVRKEFTVISGARDEIQSLVSLAEIDRLLESEAFGPPRVRLRRDELAFPKSFYSDPDEGYLYPATLQEVLRKGASLVVDNIGPLVPGLNRLERSIERRLKEKVLINAYLSFNKGGAFNAHYDDHDVLVVQVHGHKHWQLLGTVEPSSVSIKPWPDGALGPSNVTWEQDIAPGDMLFIPRGTWHRATVCDDISVHLTITIVSRNGLDFAIWAFKQLGSDDLLTRDLPQLAGEEALDAHGAALKARIAEILGRLDVHGFLAATDGQCRLVTHFDLRGARAPAETDVLRSTLRRPLRPRAVDSSSLIEVRAGGQPHVLSAPMYVALSEIDSREEGIALAALIAKFADRWDRDAVLAATGKLAEKGLIVVEPLDAGDVPCDARSTDRSGQRCG
jgi:ribosomal protein L16 Arg81 hydroxylase